MDSNFRQVCNARAVYFTNENGLLLIKTEKSSIENEWTTPGGNIPCNYDPIESLIRVVGHETGIYPFDIQPNPFFSRHFLLPSEMKTMHISAYRVEFDPDLFTKKEGLTPSGLPYRFAGVDELLADNIRLTETTRKIVDSHEILKPHRASYIIGFGR